jgi:Domain of unknown function (DUF4440)
MAKNPSPVPPAGVVNERLTAWTKAEFDGDVAALDALLHKDFLGVGPYGFLLDRKQWLARFGNGLHYDAFEFIRMGDPRIAEAVALVIGTQRQQGTYNDQPVNGEFRTSLVLAGAEASIVHVQLSLGSPPVMPS